MSFERFDVVIAGAGVVGLAIARSLSLVGREVLVIEREPIIGAGTSSRNSEVIHAGIYYPPGSLKARLCVEGRERLYRYCEDRGVAHRRIGKIIVATENSHRSKLEKLLANGIACGVDDLSSIDAKQACLLEPQLNCLHAILSPSTGIVDSHGLMMALQGEAEAHGSKFAFNATIDGGMITAHGIELSVIDRASQQHISIVTDNFVNAAGLGSVELANRIGGFPKGELPRLRLARGCYFSLNGRAPFSRLIYPLHGDGGLGVHLTLDLAGAARFGPDVEWIDDIDYRVDARRADAFYGEIRRYWPGLPHQALSPAFAGIRPKISGPGEAAQDFRIDGPREHGVAGCVNLFGIESPGLTAALALADKVRQELDR